MRRQRTRLEERERSRRRRHRLRQQGLTARGTVPVRPDLSKPRGKMRRRRSLNAVTCVVELNRGSGWNTWSRHRDRSLAVRQVKKLLRGCNGRNRVDPSGLRIVEVR